MKKVVRLLVCGGRGYDGYENIFTAIMSIREEFGFIEVLMHGGARGQSCKGIEYSMPRLSCTMESIRQGCGRHSQSAND